MEGKGFVPCQRSCHPVLLNKSTKEIGQKRHINLKQPRIAGKRLCIFLSTADMGGWVVVEFTPPPHKVLAKRRERLILFANELISCFHSLSCGSRLVLCQGSYFSKDCKRSIQLLAETPLENVVRS